MQKIELDLHTHSVMSGHAYSTIQEMAEAARQKGLKHLGIAEHGPMIPGTCDPIYFRNLYVIPRHINGVRMWMGAEVNIVDYQGTLDLDDSYLVRLDHVIAGLHRLCYTSGTKQQNTEAVLGAMHHPCVNIISHPADGTAELDLAALVRASARTRTLLEVNNSSLFPKRGNPVARSLQTGLLKLCKLYDTPVILGSDAHISYSVADYTYLYDLLKETEFPDELIVNYDAKRFFDFTGLSDEE